MCFNLTITCIAYWLKYWELCLLYQYFQGFLFTVECRYNAVQYIMILTEAEYKLERQITNYTPYLALRGELCGVFCDDSVKIDRVITTPHCNICPCYFFIYHPSNQKWNRGRYQHISIQCRRYRLTLGHYVGLVWRVSQCVHIYCIQLPWTPVRFDLHAVLRFNTSPGQTDMHFIIIPKFHGPLSITKGKKRGIGTWILLQD